MEDYFTNTENEKYEGPYQYDIPEPDVALSEDEYYNLLLKETMKDWWYQSNYGYNPQELNDEAKEQFEQNEKEIAKAARLGADKEDVEDMLDTNSVMAKEIVEINKELEQTPNPFLKREIKQERKEAMNTLKAFGVKIENANLSFSISGKMVYKELSKPFRELCRAAHSRKASRLTKRNEKVRQKLKKTLEKADEKAMIRLQKRMKTAAKKNRQLKEEFQQVEIYRSVRDIKKINRINRTINNLVVATNTQKAMIDRSVAYETILEKKIDENKRKRDSNRDQLKNLPTKEERQIIKEEKKLEKTINQIEKEQRKLDAINRRNDVKGAEERAVQTLRVVREQIRSALDQKTEEACKISDEKETERIIATLDKNLMTGESVVIETERDKFRAYKELSGDLKLEKWNDRRQAYEETSKLATISAFAKDQKLVTKKIDELFKGTSKPEPEKEEIGVGDRSL